MGGTRAYEFARQGKEVELKSRPIEITDFEITFFDLPLVGFRICCTKGTYIRSIARDFGLALNSGAYLTELCRTKIGDYSLENAVTPEDYISNMERR